MKRLRRLLLASASVLALSTPARADFIITPIVFGIFAAAPIYIAPAAIYAGVQAALVAGLSVASSLIGRQSQKSVDPGQYKNTFQGDANASEINAIGRCMLGGPIAFGNTAGALRFRMPLHAKGPLVAVEAYRLGGREVTVEPDGNVSSPPYAAVGGSWVNIQTRVGDGTETAWAGLVSAFPSLWTSAHRVRGVAHSLVEYISPGVYTEKFGKLYQGGEPGLSVEGRWNTVPDPRVSGFDQDDEATWVWSMNGPLCALRILLCYPEIGTDDIDWVFMADEADRADAVVATLTGTEPRSQCSGIWASEAQRGDTMQDVLDSIGAEIVTTEAGLIRIRLIDDAPEAEVEMTDRNITEWHLRSGPEAVERPNLCVVKYYSPERNFEIAEIDMTGIGWARVEDEIDRYGEKQLVIELPFCPSASQAQRIARRKFLTARADSGTVQANWSGLAAWGETYCGFALSDLDETLLAAIAPPRIDDDNGTVEIPFTAWPADLVDNPWNPATMEAAAPDTIGDLQYTSTLDTPAAPAEAIMVQYPGGGYEMRMRFAGVSGGTIAEATYRTYTAGLPDAWQSMTEYQGAAGRWHAWEAGDLSGDDVDTRCRFFDADEEGSYFSAILNSPSIAIDNTTPSAPAVDAVNHETTPGVPDGVDLTFSTDELRVVKFLAEYQYDGSGWTAMATHNDVRPDIEKTATISGLSNGTISDKTMDWRVSASTSDGTQSTYATGSVVIPGNPP